MNGSDLRQILARERISISDLAAKLGMTQPNLSMLFKVQDVKTGILEKICDALGVTLDFFYEGTPYLKAEQARFDESKYSSGMVSKSPIESRRHEDSKTKDEEIMFLKGQVQALQEMNQMLIEKSSGQNKTLGYQKKNA